MTLPRPEPGLVIRYSYLWAADAEAGRDEGSKDRPCAIVAGRRVVSGLEIVTVVPVTHSPPRDANDAIELPAALKAHLGLDAKRSWIIVSETNDFVWPGPDIRPVPGRTGSKRYTYGVLPPRFFSHVRDRILARANEHRLRRISRSE
ncbi:hypothetical protein [Rhizobium sp. TRM95796]|uniref:hypothetical protein n=1 Tax=Rhizobium sp. TRM95796 TaxID=2979862 RepID=UPI0021E7AAD0|nr:hypothetical protein [Rhizobium sp. TRM95796]MCV3766426.1 hypothetical protein [Rhizobium sp. TRM95796]